jgi:hypothetical protein
LNVTLCPCVDGVIKLIGNAPAGFNGAIVVPTCHIRNEACPNMAKHF